MIKICELCGKEFKGRKTQRFCSNECKAKFFSKKIKCNCEICGKEIEIKKSEYDNNKHHYCSMDCHYDAHKKTIKCKKCGKIFIANEKRIYCSHECAINDISHNQKTTRETIYCKRCGKEFTAHLSDERMFCSKECVYEWRKEHPDLYFNQSLWEKGRKNFYDKFYSTINDIELLSSYVDARTKILCKCTLHNQSFETLPSKIINGVRSCSKCQHSEGENIIREYLVQTNIDFIPQHKFKDCKDIHRLPFDFYLPGFNLCIEYDGEQHFKPVTWGGISKEKAECILLITFKHDIIKTNYCYDNNIKLIRIPYYKKQDIIKILKEELKR